MLLEKTSAVWKVKVYETAVVRELEAKKARSFQNFVYRILRIGEKDIDPKVKGVWKMRFRPIDDVVKNNYLRYAREAGVEEGIEKGIEKGIGEGKFEVARKMLARKMSVSDIIDITGLNERDILSIQ
ncbi:hypothetical protein FACS1894187_25970 [Synergistales bacterium]|nr:hypothetical protein FACS1894187_25970 [Synergistales bacterium]